MKKILTIAIAALCFIPAAFAQTDDSYKEPLQKGDMLLSLGWGWDLQVYHDDYRKPVNPLFLQAEYILTTIQDDKIAIGAGAYLGYEYVTWFLHNAALVGYDTTTEEKMLVYAAMVSGYYHLDQGFDLYAKAYYGRLKYVGYDQTYSGDTTYAAPPVSAPTDVPAMGIFVGISNFFNEHLRGGIELGIGDFENIGFNITYKF